jgi:YihY family inner membrane protein
MWKRLCGPHLVKKADLLGTYATALAYSFVLSVVPLLVVAVALTDALLGSFNPKAYHEILVSVLPVETDQSIVTITEAVENTWHHDWAKTLGLLFAIYTSFNLMNQIVRTLIFIFDDSRRVYEWNVKIFIKTIALLAVWTFLLLAIIVSSIMTLIVHRSAHYLSVPWRVTSDLVMIASLFAAVFATYFLVPSKRRKLRDIADGALVASLGWISCGLVFREVLPQVFGANMVYKALGSVVIILLWAMACAWSFILGACWTVRFPTRSARKG